ncbi:MAG TPA: GLPGLI family protein [Salinivirgaceae bacterium]|nr:GLPGLI family protein [Salinivirgaceae bacterium]
MKTRIIYSLLLFSLLGTATQTLAQIIRTYAMSKPEFVIFHKDISKFEVLDSSYINITYQLKYKPDPTNAQYILEDMMSLQIGRSHSKFFSLNMHRNDSVCTEISKRELNLPLNEVSWQGYEIFRNIKTKELTVTNRVPYSSVVYKYVEPQPVANWQLHPETDTVFNYRCHKATVELFGRNYTAWYTTDIPTRANLWKFSGLPGLILKVYDENEEYVWECVGLNQNPEAIVLYDWGYKDMSKEKWQEFETSMYKNAGQFIKNSGHNVVVVDNSEKGFHSVPLDWQATYNPIEVR